MEKILPITRNNDFRRAYKRGKSHVSPLLVAYVLKNRLGCTRVGITTSKKNRECCSAQPRPTGTAGGIPGAYWPGKAGV